MVVVHLTNGFGNNMFQYIAGRLLAQYHNQDLVCKPYTSNYYAVDSLKAVGVTNIETGRELLEKHYGQFIQVNDDNYQTYFDSNWKTGDFYLEGYFEDYRFYYDNIDVIKSWFPKIDKRNDNDLVLHFRTGDRLFMKNEFYTKPRIENYINAISRFNFDKLHIVTDFPEWKRVTADELSSMNQNFHHPVAPADSVPIEDSVKFINEMIDGLDKFEPNVQKRTISDDFNFIRSFNNILFEHGTLSWWAAVLSDAQKVGVYKNWRPFKGSSNKNLSQIPLDSWFGWE